MPALILDQERFNVTVERLCYELIEHHDDFRNTAIIGLQPRGVFLARKIKNRLNEILGNHEVLQGDLDVTFYREDFRRRDEPLRPQESHIDFLLEGKNVVLVDDVLYTGRTVRAGLDALLDYGRPDKVEFLVLVDRRFSRQLPIDSDYVGIRVDTRSSQNVKVEWKEIEGANQIWLKE